MTLSLSPAEARKLVLNSQRVLRFERKGQAKAATLDAIQHLGYIQIDTISVVARAHHHTLWSRNPRYKTSHLDALLAERKIFEFWSHAAAYLPMSDYRFAIPRMQEEKKSKGHWHTKNPKLMRQVLKRIRDEGALSTRDFEDTGGSRAVWERKPAKYALEQLFMEGKIMTTRREGFQKVYDLTERVLPAETDVTAPTKAEYARFLITRFLNAHGLGKPQEVSHLRQGFKTLIKDKTDEMLENGELISVSAAGEQWLMLPGALDVLDQPMSRATARILSPFDNLVILRKRIQSLFGFDYQIECYVPAEKRKFGYFCLPVIWQGKLVARMDCKAHRDQQVMEVRRLAIEPQLNKLDDFAHSLGKQLEAFSDFNDCTSIVFERVTKEGKSCPSLKSALQEQ